MKHDKRYKLKKMEEKKKSATNHHQGSVVQSVVSLTSSLRGQLIKYFMTLLLNTLKFFVQKMREAFALHFFNKKYWQILNINV